MSKIFDKNSLKCKEAIRLKYGGETYSVIAKKLNISIGTLNSWFCFGGLLKEEYEKYRDEQNEFLGDLSDEILARNVHTASNMLIALMGSPENSVKFRAVKEILDRVRGKPKETIEHQGLFGSGLNYEQILRKSRDKPPDG